MPPTRLSRLCLLPVLLACTALPAQTGFVAVGSAPVTERLPVGYSRSFTTQADGTMWCLSRENDASVSPTATALKLYRSDDQGVNWFAVADTPTLRDSRGAIVAGRDPTVLHVAWCAIDTGSYTNVYYQDFDTATGTWIGTAD